MSGFTADWLFLREAEDARARDTALLADLSFSGSKVLRVVDLGAGSGNNLRYLAPRLSGPQHWMLIDDDEDLLAAVAKPKTAQALEMEIRKTDLADGLDALPLDGCDLLTASAFFDLVSHDWVMGLATRCANAGIAAGLFALNVDGRIAWTPQEPEDAEIVKLFHAHMRSDKGFGPSLGPKSGGALVEAFTAAGYRVRTGDSAWRLSPAQDQMQYALLAFQQMAARDMAPERTGMIENWARRRMDHIAKGESGLTVGHCDVLVRCSRGPRRPRRETPSG